MASTVAVGNERPAVTRRKLPRGPTALSHKGFFVSATSGIGLTVPPVAFFGRYRIVGGWLERVGKPYAEVQGLSRTDGCTDEPRLKQGGG